MNPSVDERLDLFISVCNAVQHAHQKGVIHRDLKPSNILVKLYDGRPIAKVIDFGIAKALQNQSPLTAKTLLTKLGEVVGAPQYLSPEQAEMNALDVDTRTATADEAPKITEKQFEEAELARKVAAENAQTASLARQDVERTLARNRFMLAQSNWDRGFVREANEALELIAPNPKNVEWEIAKSILGQGIYTIYEVPYPINHFVLDDIEIRHC